MLSKERFNKACNFEPVDRPPVWMMRQAGRTLKEYLAIREKYSFTEVMKSAELAAEVTLQPLRRFPVDAAIIFADILTIPEALGQEVGYSPLSIQPPIKTPADIDKLNLNDMEKRVEYVINTIRTVQKEVGHEKAVLGFSGAPYTLACYMIEGSSSKNFVKIREMMYHHPEAFTKLMERLTEAVTNYMAMQMDAGVNAIQLFDTWAGELNPYDYDRYVLPYIQKIFQNLKHKNIPMIYYINGIGNLLERAKASGANIIGVDWRLTLTDVRKRLGEDTVVQGNLDPALLFAPKEEIRRCVWEMLDGTKGQGHIANLGHGLIPTTPVEGIAAFVDSVVEWRADR